MNFNSVFNDTSLKENSEEILSKIDYSIFEEEKEIIEKLKALKGDNNWELARDNEKFELVEREYSFGTRLTYVPKGNDSNSNLELQGSRGLSFNDGDDLESMVNKFVLFSTQLSESDKLRINELNNVIKHCRENLNNLTDQTKDANVKSAIRKAFLEQNKRFAEIGFRVPHILRYYKEKQGFEQSTGFDINELSVKICKKLNWDVRFGDLADWDQDISEFDIVVAYHVFEHVSDPLESLKNVRNSAKHGCIFHIEIPIEPGTPRLSYGHLFPFEKGDLESMLVEAGFIPISNSNIPHSGGPAIERITAVVCNP